VAVTPCDENGAPSTCPGPGFPANYVGVVDASTGAVSTLPLGGIAVQPHGMLYLP
jgi:hypothetical protein